MGFLFDVGSRWHRRINEVTLPIFPFYKKTLRSWIKEFQTEGRFPGTVLDAGSGTSSYRALFPPSARFISLDVDSRCRPTVQGDASQMPFRDAVFDVIVCSALLEHVEDPDAVLEEFNRILALGGMVFLSVPFLFGEHGRDFRRWTRFSLRRWLEGCGFRVLDLRELGGLFTVLAVTLSQSLTQIFPPAMNRDNWGIRRNWPRYALHMAFQILLTPVMYLLTALDLIDRKRDFTVGYAVSARKCWPVRP